jgi:hypothetical protein
VADAVELELIDDQIVVRKVRPILTLEELFQGFESTQRSALVWDEDVQGREW